MEKVKTLFESKVAEMNKEMEELQNNLSNSLANVAAKEEREATIANSEELALLTE